MIFTKTTLYLVILVVLLAMVGWVFSNIVSYFVISFVLAAILRNPTNYIAQAQLQGVRIPRFIAVLISFGILVGIISMFVLLFVPLVSDQIKVLVSLDYAHLFEKINKPLERIENIIIDSQLVHEQPGFIAEGLKEKMLSLVGKLQFSTILNNIIATTGNFFVGVIAVLFITSFLLLEKGLMRQSVIAVIPNRYFEVTISAMYKIEKMLSNYLLALFLQMLSVFTLASFGLIIGGVKYAITIGIFAALVNVVPFIGPMISASFGLFVGLSTSQLDLTNSSTLWVLTIKILAVFAFVQLTDNVVVQPVIFSKSIKAHPLEIFVIVFAGATLAGALGMVVAIPTYTILKVSFIELKRGYQQYRIFKQ